jgi:hypothetical protein
MAWEIVKQIIFWMLTASLGALAAYFRTKYVRAKKEEESLKNGMQSLLRTDIIRLHDKFTERGYAPIYAKEAIEKSYVAYHNLGGNGVITHLYEEMMNLPVCLTDNEENK